MWYRPPTSLPGLDSHPVKWSVRLLELWETSFLWVKSPPCLGPLLSLRIRFLEKSLIFGLHCFSSLLEYQDKWGNQAAWKEEPESGVVSKLPCEPVVQPYCGPPVRHKKAATALYRWLSERQPHTSGRELWGMEELCPPTSGSETRSLCKLDRVLLVITLKLAPGLTNVPPPLRPQINRRKTVDPITFILGLMFWKLLWSFKNTHFFPSSSSKFQTVIILKRPFKETLYVNAISAYGSMLKIQIHSKNRMINTFYSAAKDTIYILYISCGIYWQFWIFVLYTDVIVCVKCHVILYDLDIVQNFFPRDYSCLIRVWSHI